MNFWQVVLCVFLVLIVWYFLLWLVIAGCRAHVHARRAQEQHEREEEEKKDAIHQSKALVLTELPTTRNLYTLELDGTVAGAPLAVDGTGAQGVEVDEAPQQGVVKKHLAGVKYEDITLTVSTGMSAAFYAWVQAALTSSPLRKSGAIILADEKNEKEQHRLEFKNALITEIDLPALDAESKDAAKMTVKFRPEQSRLTVAHAGDPVPPAPEAKQKAWLTSNFRLELGNLPASRVNKIEAIVVKQAVNVELGSGNLVLSGPPRFSDLALTTPESPESVSFFDVFTEFVINGNNGDDKEMTGRLDYMQTGLANPLFSLDLSHVGIFKLEPVPPAPAPPAANGGPRRIKAELYVEQMALSPGPNVGFL